MRESENRLDVINNKSPTVNEKFLLVRYLSDQIEVKPEILPSKILLTLDSELDIERHHLAASNLYEDSLKKNNLEETFNTIIYNPSFYTKDVHRRLRHTRLTGVIFRDANRLFTENHRNPEEFHIFIKELGKFNDGFNSSKKEPSAEIVLSLIKQNRNLIKTPLCDIDSVNTFMKKQIDLTNEYLNSQNLSATMFHDLRKTSRTFLSYFLIKILQGSFSDDSFKTYAFLRKINGELGNSLNQKNYNVSESTRNLINSFLDRVTF